VAQQFDVVYRPVQVLGYPEPDTTVIARRVEAIDRTHAILWWIRNELQLTIDPVDMFDAPYNYGAACSCNFFILFEMQELGRIARLRTGEPAVPTVHIECDPCELHSDGSGRDEDAPNTRDWNGMFAAWKHDPKRSKTFKQGGVEEGGQYDVTTPLGQQ
jgi:hypothetical protein